MSRLDPARLSVRFRDRATAEGPVLPRRYTLTHSDATGKLFLTIEMDYDREQIDGWYTRLVRDEVLAEWLRTTPETAGTPPYPSCTSIVT